MDSPEAAWARVSLIRNPPVGQGVEEEVHQEKENMEDPDLLKNKQTWVRPGAGRERRRDSVGKARTLSAATSL